MKNQIQIILLAFLILITAVSGAFAVVWTRIDTAKTAKEIRQRAEVAALTTMAKAQGQEVSGQDAEQMLRQAREMEAMRKAAESRSGGPTAA